MSIVKSKRKNIEDKAIFISLHRASRSLTQKRADIFISVLEEIAKK